MTRGISPPIDSTLYLIIFFISPLIFTAQIPQGTAITQFEINDINATVTNTGVIFSDPNGSAGFESPIGSGKHTVYSSGLWVSGYDSGGQLHIAAEKYLTGDYDFTPGPFTSLTGAAATNMASAYDSIWEVSKAEIDYHIGVMNGSINPPGGYAIPASILNWPGDNPNGGVLAPYVDYNSNGHYEPQQGDYPCIKGDKALFFVINDAGALHFSSGGSPLEVEIRVMIYGYENSNIAALNNTVFVEYTVINMGISSFNNARLSLYSDIDIGGSDDDYIGSDIQRGMFFGYNADDLDDLGNSSKYGHHPPAQGVVLLSGPHQDADGLDNPGPSQSNGYQPISYSSAVTNTSLNYGLDGISYKNLGRGYGDGVPDNEKLGLRNFMYWTRTAGYPRTDPATQNPVQFGQAVQSIWLDGTTLTYGGNGYSTTNTVVANHAFLNDSDPMFWTTGGVNHPNNWAMDTTGHPVDDVRGLGSTGPFTFLPGAVEKLEVAFVFAHNTVDSGAVAGVNLLKSRVDDLWSFYDVQTDNCSSTNLVSIPEIQTFDFSVFPNPANDALTISGTNTLNAGYEIYNAVGELVLGGSVNQTINVSNLTPGIYLIQLDYNGKAATKKIIINR